jgi:hypothetical protein
MQIFEDEFAVIQENDGMIPGDDGEIDANL